MSSIINGKNIKISIFGQSHSEAIGCVIDGLPAGIAIDMDKVREFMQRRAPGKNEFSTQRSEDDEVEILSGIADGVTCGAPLCGIIKNKNQNSKDYSSLKFTPRPSHADLGNFVKTNGANDIRGGGHSSGRLTAPLCFAGAVAIQILNTYGINVYAHIYSLAGINDTAFDPLKLEYQGIDKAYFPVIDQQIGEQMQSIILQARDMGDSVGGIIECGITGAPCGIGDPIFDGIENKLSANIFGIPAVKGIEFGAGFDLANMMGSTANDEFAYDENGTPITLSNNNGGILGGITTGMPIIFRVVIKPTPSIYKEQQTIDLKNGTNTTLSISGRHDPCIVPRAVPVVEAVSAITMLDFIL